MTFSDPWVVLALCIAGTFVWRAFGVAVASRIDISGALFQWFNCVAYAMLAGLITRVILIPSGTLAETPDLDRIGAMVIGLIVFFMARRNIFAGTGVAFIVFLSLSAARYFSVL